LVPSPYVEFLQSNLPPYVFNSYFPILTILTIFFCSLIPWNTLTPVTERLYLALSLLIHFITN